MKVIVLLLAVFISFSTEASIQKSLPTKEEINWLIKNIYFEARDQGTAGKLAVLNVTMNRVNDPNFPNTIKGVVTQKSNGVCQFSWYCDRNSGIIYDWNSYYKIRDIVLNYFFQKKWIDITDGALYYHANYVKPSWSKTKKRIITIETHIFYR